jgi:CheY-like chemotaxis protein
MSVHDSILIIEDSHDLRVNLRQQLEDTGWSVTTVANARDGLKILRTGFSPSSIILDINLPIMSGDQFLEEKNKCPSLKKIPVILISGDWYANDLFREVPFLLKPFSKEDLMTALEASSC